MKKLIAAIAVIIFIVLLSVSCGASKTCPAYSSNDIEQTDGENV
jgi:hypothetical protein